MDIPALSMALAQNKVLTDFGVAMLSKNLDVMESQGDTMVASLDAMSQLSVDPNLGGSIDIRI